ncbi:MAG: hypothetical protein RQ897_05285 [Thermoflexus sp.]|nr:hypothetical protein [Thermoflexus sp.]MDT7947747.1 hypothetical protein [Thermoflexus sp.]
MQESFIKLLIASIVAFIYAEALAWLRYKGKISRFFVSLAIGVGCGVIMIWWHGDIRIFPSSLCLFQAVSLALCWPNGSGASIKQNNKNNFMFKEKICMVRNGGIMGHIADDLYVRLFR